MKKIKYLLFPSLFLLFDNSVSAQELFQYGNKSVSQQELLKNYHKNNINQKDHKISKQALEEYITMYGLYKMKVEEANHLNLKNDQEVIGELNNYKSQLAQQFATDKKIIDNLVKEAYERLKEQIDVSHILITIPKGADTILAFKQADSLYYVLQNDPQAFESIAKRFSKDETSAGKGGNIGFITALETPYPFENTAYSLPKGKISHPIRTIYGYHIIKVIDRTKNPGEVQVAQILFSTSKTKGENAEAEALVNANKVYQALKKGADFNEMVQQYSDDQYSIHNNGILVPFASNVMDKSFENASFNLQKENDIAEPIKTGFGYHIIRLIKKTPIGSFDDEKAKLYQQVEKDSRAGNAQEKYEEEFKKNHKYIAYPENLTQLINAIPEDENSKQSGFELTSLSTLQKPLFSLNGKTYSQYQFATYLHGLTSGKIAGRKEKTVSDIYKIYESNILNSLKEEILYNSNETYKSLIDEYLEGVLLFKMMNEKVWAKASIDTAGLNSFYNSHKENYIWPPSVEGYVYQSQDKSVVDLFHNDYNKGTGVAEILNKINGNEHGSKISEQKGRYDLAHFNIPTDKITKGKASPVFEMENGIFGTIVTDKVYKNKEYKPLAEIKGLVISDYQNYLEKQWNEELLKKYPLKVNEKVINKIIK